MGAGNPEVDLYSSFDLHVVLHSLLLSWWGAGPSFCDLPSGAKCLGPALPLVGLGGQKAARPIVDGARANRLT